MQLRVYQWFCPFALLAVCGCGSSKTPKWPDPIPATGTVTYDDKPLADAMVTFSPEGATPGQGATAFTDQSGKYSLQARWVNGKTKPGAIPGKYGVRISRMVKPDGSIWKPDPNVGPASVGAREELPQEYSLQSELKAEVAKDKAVHDFKLEKKPDGVRVIRPTMPGKK